MRIFIGSENQLFSLSGSSLVVSPYRDSEQRIVGVLGVIGPTRLNYARIVPMVDYTAKVVEPARLRRGAGYRRCDARGQPLRLRQVAEPDRVARRGSPSRYAVGPISLGVTRKRRGTGRAPMRRDVVAAGDASARRSIVLAEDQARLPSADQLDIDLGEQLGVEERAVEGAPADVDLVARAERIERIRPGRVLAPRQHQRVDDALRRASAPCRSAPSSTLTKAISNVGVMGDQRRVADELDQFVGDRGEERLVLRGTHRRGRGSRAASIDIGRSGLM